MASNIRAFYKVGFGLAGCYLDDNQSGAFEVNTRRELAAAIRSDLEVYDLPASCFAEVSLRRLWSAITFARSTSSYTFHIHHGAYVLTFYGLTEREYLEDRANGGGADEDDREALRAYDE